MAAIPNDWWPDFIAPLEDATFVQGAHVTVAEIVEPGGKGTYRQVFTALASPSVAEAILATPASIGYDVSCSGHPSIDEGSGPPGYKPRFWIFGGEVAPGGLEPLVVSWRSASTTLLRIDQGFLMTYALVPRVIPSADGEVDEHWDDNETPGPDIVLSRPRSVYDYPSVSHAWVRVRREYLEDYAFLRNQFLLHVAYGHAEGVVAGPILDALREIKSAQLRRPGRELTVHLMNDSGQVHVRYWVVRKLLAPSTSPITAGRWDYGELTWPGITGGLTDRSEMPVLDFVYIKDSVLAEYEGRANEGFAINPASGSVNYRSQWAVGYVQRIGRDLLQLEVRKLYEGCPPSVVRHWHSCAVAPPSNPFELHGRPNVATRSKRVLFALLALGESVSRFGSSICRKHFSSEDIVGLQRAAIEYSGWWNAPYLEPVARHLPADMRKDRFLDRMTDLTKAVIECFREGVLREMVRVLGYDAEMTKELRSLRLLDLLVRHCAVANQTGLNPLRDAQVIRDRLEDVDTDAVAPLVALNSLRLLDAHRAGRNAESKMNEALVMLGVELSSTAGGWGEAADRVYDEIGDALERLAEVIDRAANACNAS